MSIDTAITDESTGTPEGSRSSSPGPRQWNRFLIIALLLHIPLFVYPVLRLGEWLSLPFWLTLLILVPVVSSQMISRIYLRGHNSGLAQVLRQKADFVLGVSPIVLLTLLAFELFVWLGDLPQQTAAWGVLGVSLVTGVVGVLVAISPSVKTIKLSSPNLKAPVRFVQITDVHIGSRSRAFLEKIIYKINELDADFVCITGDFIDATNIQESELISLKSVPVPIYFCLGNHEKYEDLDAIIRRLKNLGVQVLRNETRMFRDDIQVVGIDDMEDPLQVDKQLKHIELDAEAFKLLLYHRPRGLEAAAEAGIELTISGHTHNGQIFPFNLIVGRVFDRIEGMYQIGRSRQYVSQGTGTWGPVMRIGTRSEITLFEFEPEASYRSIGRQECH